MRDRERSKANFRWMVRQLGETFKQSQAKQVVSQLKHNNIYADRDIGRLFNKIYKLIYLARWLCNHTTRSITGR